MSGKLVDEEKLGRTGKEINEISLRNEGKDNNHLYVIYGSRTGNSRAAAELAHEYAGHVEMQTSLIEMENATPALFRKAVNILVAVSTHGEGDPPSKAEKFYHYIHGPDAPSMENKSFSIIALGDSSYSDFCKTGKDIRKRFIQLGAREVYPIVECDIDFEENACTWAQAAVESFRKRMQLPEKQDSKSFSFRINKRDTEYENAFYAKVLDKYLLTRPEYEKRTMHLVLSMDGFAEKYQPGDTLGIYMNNSRPLVDKLLKVLGYDSATVVRTGERKKLLKEALLCNYEITLVTPVVISRYAKLTKNVQLNRLLEDAHKVEEYCMSRDLIDLVNDFPVSADPSELLSVLRNLTPRQYSLASSPLAVPGEAHLTIGLMEYELNGRVHRGVAATYLADRVTIGDTVPLYLQTNEKFRLPADGHTPVIMIATGTGIAPYRAFLQQREITNASGENWLIFGDRYKKSDFLYRSELEGFLKRGVLHKLDTVFSRDQKRKKYIQELLNKHAEEIFSLINNAGAVIYLCGNKRHMGKEVKECIENIIASEGKMSKKDASDYIRKLKENNRYQTDLY
jgi:sulfite reductase (NADPH) flavoprotein alpha-component